MPEFVPDDDDDDDEQSLDEFIEEHQARQVDDQPGPPDPDDPAYGGNDVEPGAERNQDHLDTDHVDVDPALFGEWPEGRIEEVVVEDSSDMVSDEQIHEWRREATLAFLTGACPHCDGPIQYGNAKNGMQKVVCEDCEEGWLRNDDGNAGKL